VWGKGQVVQSVQNEHRAETCAAALPFTRLIPSHPCPNRDEISRTGGRKEQLISSRSVWLIPFRARINSFLAEREEWLALHPEPRLEADEREYHEKFGNRFEELAGYGVGLCVLRQPQAAGKMVALSGILTANDMRSDILS